MRKSAMLVAFALFGASMLSGCGYEFIEPGDVGIKVKLAGDHRGVQETTIVSGRVFYNSIFYDVVQFPVYLQTAVWTQSPHEGNVSDESITFNSIEGSSLNVDVSITYQFIAEKIPQVYMEFRKTPEEIMHVYVRSMVRDAFSRAASTMKVMDIFGEGKQRLLTNVKDELNKELEPKGIHFDSVSFVGKPRVDQGVEQRINAVISASQKALEEQNKVAEIKAIADQAIERARGESESITLLATAQAQANKILAESITPELAQYMIAKQWDGRLPQVTGDSVPLLPIQLQDNAPKAKSGINPKDTNGIAGEILGLATK